jgi:N6-adenosine-specific RNA methylase IME4
VGFQAKTTLTWVKQGLGLGRYFRTSTEHIVFGTRGNLLLREQNLRNWFQAPNGAHSEKPASFYELVEKACFGPYLELFARRHRPGWICWGAEVDTPIHQTGFDVKAEEPENAHEAST